MEPQRAGRDRHGLDANLIKEDKIPFNVTVPFSIMLRDTIASIPRLRYFAPVTFDPCISSPPPCNGNAPFSSSRFPTGPGEVGLSVVYYHILRRAGWKFIEAWESTHEP